MKLNTLDQLFEDQIKDLYSAESQLIKALPKMAKRASSPALKSALTDHLEETKGQLQRLEIVAEKVGMKPTGKKCAAMEGLIEEGSEVLEADGPDTIIDLALIAAAQRVEHYEISAYGTARALAEQLGHKNAISLLQETLDEESAADDKLTEISESELLPQAGEGSEEEEDEEE